MATYAQAPMKFNEAGYNHSLLQIFEEPYINSAFDQALQRVSENPILFQNSEWNDASANHSC